MGTPQDDPNNILLKLSPIFVHEGWGAELLRNQLGLENNKERSYLENGDHQTALAIVYETSWKDLNRLLKENGKRVEDIPILRELAKMDGNAELSPQELSAGLLAAEALPNMAAVFKQVVLPNTTGKRLEIDANGKGSLHDHQKSDPRDTAMALGMSVNIDERNLKVAVAHMKEYMATARQFLGDNYNVNVVDENNRPVDTRNPDVDAEYSKMMRDSFKAIKQTVGDVNQKPYKGRG